MASLLCVLVGNKNHLPRLFLTKKTMDMKLNLLFVFLIATQCLTAQSFREKGDNYQFAGVSGSSIAFADVDGDGDEDVLISGENTIGLVKIQSILYINNGEGKFTEVANTPFVGVKFGSIAFADVDGDGDQDVLISGSINLDIYFSKLYTNDGMGNFTEVSGTPFEEVLFGSIAFVDVDGDGDQDVLITGQNAADHHIAKLYKNSGMGNFTEVTGTPFVGVYQGSIAIADVDGDGDQDVLMSGQNAAHQRITKIYTNDGQGNFTEVLDTPFEGVRYSSTAFSDVDGDGDQDVLILGQNAAHQRIAKLYKNTGLGDFIEVTGTPFEGEYFGSIAFADVDGDGDQDVLINGSNSSAAEITKLYTNDGEGNFTEVTGTPFEGLFSGSIGFADVDGDGDQDVLITGLNSSGGEIAKLYTNDGEGNFSEVKSTPFESVFSGSIAFADVDGDGDQDVLIAGSNSSAAEITKLYTNDGEGNFTEVTGTPFEGLFSGSIAFADVDGDDDSDVLISGIISSGSISKLYKNDGKGNFIEVTGTPFEGVSSSSITFGDVDGDGDQDVLISGTNGSGYPSLKLYTNDSQGNFTEVKNTPFENITSGSTAFADVDGDGDQDVLIIGAKLTRTIARLYINDGSGNFYLAPESDFATAWANSIAFTDVDGDGDQDVFITGRNSGGISSILYTNDGSGDFSAVSGNGFEGVYRSSIAFSDVDGDGDQDVLITGQNSLDIYISKLYTNDGEGNFTEVLDTPFEGVAHSSIAFADVDGDGDEDVIITGVNNSGVPISKLYINESIINSTNEPSFKLNVDLVLYPNPVNSTHLHVNFDSGESGEMYIKIYDQLGSSLSQQRAWVGPGPQSLSVDISNLSSGSYILQLDGGKSIGVAKFIVP